MSTGERAGLPSPERSVDRSRRSTGFSQAGAPLQGALLVLAATACWASMNALVRFAATDLHPFQVAFLRNVATIVVLGPWIARVRLPFLPRRGRGLLLLIGFAESAAMLSWFLAITLMPLAEVTALYFTQPFFATILAVLFLGERASLARWSAVLCGFAGAMVILRPGFQVFQLAMGLALVCALGAAIHGVAVRALVRTENATAVVAYTFILLVPLTLPAALATWGAPTLAALGWTAAVAVVGTAGHLALAWAYRAAEASFVAPIEYMQLALAALVGYAVFAEIPDRWTWIGGGMIVASAALLARSERRRRAVAA
ncbi:MAG: DMT family transporter [Alphaproteobacteria bacterium]